MRATPPTRGACPPSMPRETFATHTNPRSAGFLGVSPGRGVPTRSIPDPREAVTPRLPHHPRAWPRVQNACVRPRLRPDARHDAAATNRSTRAAGNAHALGRGGADARADTPSAARGRSAARVPASLDVAGTVSSGNFQRLERAATHVQSALDRVTRTRVFHPRLLLFRGSSSVRRLPARVAEKHSLTRNAHPTTQRPTPQTPSGCDAPRKPAAAQRRVAGGGFDASRRRGGGERSAAVAHRRAAHVRAGVRRAGFRAHRQSAFPDGAQRARELARGRQGAPREEPGGGPGRGGAACGPPGRRRGARRDGARTRADGGAHRGARVGRGPAGARGGGASRGDAGCRAHNSLRSARAAGGRDVRELPDTEDAAVAQRAARPEDALQRLRRAVQAGEAPASGWVAARARAPPPPPRKRSAHGVARNGKASSALSMRPPEDPLARNAGGLGATGALSKKQRRKPRLAPSDEYVRHRFGAGASALTDHDGAVLLMVLAGLYDH